MIDVQIEAIGLAAPGLPTWAESRGVLRGEQPYVASELPAYAPPLLPPAQIATPLRPTTVRHPAVLSWSLSSGRRHSWLWRTRRIASCSCTCRRVASTLLGTRAAKSRCVHAAAFLGKLLRLWPK